MPSFEIGSVIIEDSSPPYVIAEIGVNHEGSIEKARELIAQAHAGGAQAAKFQTYKAETLASRNSPAYWDTTKENTSSQFELFKKYDTFEAADYQELAAYCQELGIDFLSTPFDAAAVGLLAPLIPAFKVASADLTNVPLLRQVAATGKPVVLSVGASTLSEIDVALDTLSGAGCRQVALLHCILNYPTSYQDANLAMIGSLRRTYPDHVIGYSDHTLPDPAMTMLTTAYLNGARILEKHFTYDKTLPGNDHYHAMDTEDLKTFGRQLDLIRAATGKAHKSPIESEQLARQNARRSIVAAQAIEVGQVLTEQMLICKRPGSGISPLLWDDVVGRRTRRAIDADQALRWDDLSEQRA